MPKNKEKIEISITKEQLRELLLATMFYSWIRGGLADREGEDFQQYEKLEQFLLKIAKEKTLTDLVEDFEGSPLPSDNLSNLMDSIIEEYDDDVFWHELTTRLGQRDFERTITPDERKYIEKEDWLPERIRDIYQKYEEEFENHGVDRLAIRE